MIPTRPDCERLWGGMELAGGLREHQAAVAGLAVRVGAALNRRGFALNVPLIEAAALLHDVKKGTPRHAEAGAQILETLGFAEVAPIVLAHMRLPDGFCPEITELTVVFLADKLFIGARAVRVEERYAGKLDAYRGQPPLARMIRLQAGMAMELERRMEAALEVGSLSALP